MTVSPTFVVQDIDLARRTRASNGQPLLAVLQATFLFVEDCVLKSKSAIPGCEKYRPIVAAEARCEAFLAINHGAKGLLYFGKLATKLTIGLIW